MRRGGAQTQQRRAGTGKGQNRQEHRKPGASLHLPSL
jgi:hypothetical protein